MTCRRDDAVSTMIKRVFDAAAAALGLILLSPLLGVVAAAVRMTTGRPVLYVQQRPGVGGKPFELLKFRTMTGERDSHGELLPDGERLTPLGTVLRRWSVDELPELWNVLRGEMSLVGPRPLLMEYLPLYDDEQLRRHDMRPGLTGLAQVSGRNDQTWEERLALDVWYVDHWSLWLDARILGRTVGQGIDRRGNVGAGRGDDAEIRGESR